MIIGYFTRKIWDLLWNTRKKSQLPRKFIKTHRAEGKVIEQTNFIEILRG